MRRTAQGFTLIEIMVVIAIIAGLVTTVAIMVPKMQETQKQTGCMGNLQQLGGLFLTHKLENPAKSMRYSGVSLWLSYRKGSSDIAKGEEKALACGGDPGTLLPQNEDDKKKWDNVDLDNPADGLCSYAGRDFKNAPLDAERTEREVIGCDRQGPDGKTMHHKDVIVCAFDSGAADRMNREELGVGSEEKIIIGPEAQNPMLRKVVYIVRKTD